MKAMRKILSLLTVVAILIVLIASSGCAEIEPESPEPPVTEMSDDLRSIFDDTVMHMSQSKYYEYNYAAMDYTVLKLEGNINAATVYAVVMYREYSYASDTPSIEFGYHEPVKAVFTKNAGGYALVSYDMAGENEKYPDGFPEDLRADADPEKYEEKHGATCLELAKTRYKMINGYPKYPIETFDATFKMPKELYETSVADDDRYAMHVISSVEDIRAYFTMLIEVYVGLSGITGTEAEIEQQVGLFLEKYPAEIFEDTSLIFIHYVFGNWNNECELEGVYNDGESLTVHLVWTKTSGLDSLEGKLFVVSMPKEELEGRTEFSLELKNPEMSVEKYVSEGDGDSEKKEKFKLTIATSPYGESRFYVDSGFHGDCELRDGYLYMYADNDRGTYAFKNLDGNRYEFVADMSTGDFGGAELTDGEIFALKR